MDRYSNSTDLSDDSSPSEAWLFAQAILGKPIPRVVPPEVKARTRRAELQRLAPLSERHAQELRQLQAAEAEARRDRERLEWAAGISTRAEEQLRALQRKEADECEACRRAEQFYESYWAGLTEWNEADHPRASKGTPTGGQWVEKGGGGGGGDGKGSFLDKITQRNRTISELTGVVTPSMIRAGRLAADLESAARLPAEVARAAAAGLGAGGKAVGNGFATAVKDVATLGLSPGQLELIGVTKEDRERGYDTAVAISTASGQILIAVGTGGTASALSKGGSIARTASGSLVAYDAAGNAMGVVKGVYDAANNGVTIANGAQVAAGALGISANLSAAKGLVKSRPPAPSAASPAQSTPSSAPAKSPSTGFRVGRHGDMPSPRPGQHSHHGVMSAWMKKTYPGYDPKKAPAILMPDTNHRATYGVYLSWRAEMTKKMGGAFDWAKVSEADMRSLSERMFDAADVPASVREEYWDKFERMNGVLQQRPPRRTIEESLRRDNMSGDAELLSAEQLKRWYGSFYDKSPKVNLEKANVPEQLWPLIPYAEFWGIADDWTREDLIEQAPPAIQRNLKAVVSSFNNDLEAWLAGPEASNRNPSDEYVAFAAMIMAADFV
jgi:hypothetical protein